MKGEDITTWKSIREEIRELVDSVKMTAGERDRLIHLETQKGLLQYTYLLQQPFFQSMENRIAASTRKWTRRVRRIEESFKSFLQQLELKAAAIQEAEQAREKQQKQKMLQR